MKTKCLIALLITGTSLHLAAQGPPQGPPPDPIATALDKNENQKLSAFEIRGAIKSLLKLDKNKDNNLSAEELRPEPPKGRRSNRKSEEADRPQAPPASSLMSALDKDQSGDLSKEELAAAVESLLKLDSDDNGKLSAEEAGLSRQEGPGGQGAPQGRQSGGQKGGGERPGGPPPGEAPAGPPRRGPGR
ncbi:hypothetical protein V2O64_01280 [Verrucomicrobiaceae bacterium 227]